MECSLISVFNFFETDNDLEDLKNKDLLFGEVVSENLALKGKVKSIPIGTLQKSIDEQDFPHLKYCSKQSFEVNDSSGNWFYVDGGKYFVISGIESEYEKVKHLESITMYSDSLIRLRIVIELLKKNVKEGLISITIDQYKEIAYRVFKNDPSLRGKDELLRSAANKRVPSMLSIPLYEDIPVIYRGRVKE